MKWIDPRGLLRIKRGYEAEFEILNRFNPYIIAMITWIENNLPRECEIEITEAWRSYDQYIGLYPDRDWNGYMQNRHAMLVAVDMKAITRSGQPCDKKCNASVTQLAGLARQAGFNGIGIYDKHIHVDFRDVATTWTGDSR